MRILTTLTYYAPHWTGLSRYAQLVAEGLAARGHHLSVVTTRHDSALPARENVNGVHVWRLPTLGRLSRGQLVPSLPSALGAAIRRHDVAQIHTPLLESALVASLCRAQNKPLVLTHHGDLLLPRGAFNSFVGSGVVSQMTLAGHAASAVVAYSDDYARHSPFLGQFGDKLQVIPPPIQIDQPDQIRVQEWKRELRLENKRIVGFAGRFVEEKGFDFLLQAIPLILERIPDAHFVFAGDVNVAYEQFFERCRPLWERNSPHLTSLGLLRDSQEIANFYALCDVFALPSRSDCFALVQAEAMLCGTPVVASDIPGARVAVQRTGAGRLVETQNPRALADGLVEVLANLPRFAPDAACVRAIFDIEKTLDLYEELYERLARGEKVARSVPQTPVTPQQNRIAPLLEREADMAYRRRALRLLEWLDPQPDERILDCGCGMGFYLRALHGLQPQSAVFGLDDDEARLERAKQETPEAHVVRGDGARLPFRDEAFDKILLSEVLEHIPDDARALHELKRILRPGGLLAISVPHARYPWKWDPFNRALVATGRAPRRLGFPVGIWTHHERLYEPHQLQNLVEEAGFEVEFVEAATHYAPPLAAFLLYGVGKPLLERGLLPANLAQQTDRFAAPNSAPTGAFALGLRALRAADRRNDAPSGRENSFVNVLLLARKPEKE